MLEALKKQMCGTWLGKLLNHFDIYVIWRMSQLIFEATPWYFRIVAVLYNFSDFQIFVFGHRAQNKNLNTPENLYFSAFSLLCL